MLWHSSCSRQGVTIKTKHHVRETTPRRGYPHGYLRLERDALARTHAVHSPRQDLARGGLPARQGRDLPADAAAAESGHVRDDLHGRLRHAADERGYQRQLHRRDGVSARRGDVRPLHQHPGQPVAHAREGRVEGRRPGHRLVRGLHAGRRGRVAALARTPQGRGQTLRQTQPGDERRLSGRVGEVLPALADRAAHRTPDARLHDARREAGARALRREHDLHRADRRRDVDGPERRRRGARPSVRRVQPPDGLRNSDPRRRRIGRVHPAVPQPGVQVGLPPQVGAVDLDLGPQVRPRLPGSGVGRLEGPQVPARRDGLLGQLPRRQHHAGGAELLAPGGADPGPVLQLHPAGIRGLQGDPAELDGRDDLLPRADRQDEVLQKLRAEGRQSALHLDDGPRIRQDGQVDALRPAGQAAAERLDGPGLHDAQEYRAGCRHAHRGAAGHVARHGRHAAGRHPQRRGRVRAAGLPPTSRLKYERREKQMGKVYTH